MIEFKCILFIVFSPTLYELQFGLRPSLHSKPEIGVFEEPECLKVQTKPDQYEHSSACPPKCLCSSLLYMSCCSLNVPYIA